MPDKIEKLTVTAKPKEINAIISFINIVYNMKDDFVSLEYNNGGSHLVIPKGYFEYATLKREDV